MEHKDVRVVINREEFAQAPPDVKNEDNLLDWSGEVYLLSMRVAAAGVLAAEGSLDKAASVLWWTGFQVPPGYFPSDHEADDDVESLRMWVEADAENIDYMIETDFFRLAATGRLLDKVEV